MTRKKIVIDAPSHPVIRYRFDDDRHITLDLRGIRNPQSPFNGRLNPSQGMKRKFMSPEHLQSMVNEYFESCNGPLFDRSGNLVRDMNGNLVKTQVKPYTVSGLALYLGISTESLKKYRLGLIDTILDEMKAETDDTLTFAGVLARAKQTIEAYAEGRLYDHEGNRGAQFVLDNCYHWVSHREQADIDRLREESKLRREELELRKKALDDEENEDNNFTINIVGKGKEQ